MDSSIKSVLESMDSNNAQSASVTSTTTTPAMELEVEQTSGPKEKSSCDQSKEMHSFNVVDEGKTSANSECNKQLDLNSSSASKTEHSNSIDDSSSEDKSNKTNSIDCLSKPQGDKSTESTPSTQSHEDQTEQSKMMTDQESKPEQLIENIVQELESTELIEQDVKPKELEEMTGKEPTPEEKSSSQENSAVQDSLSTNTVEEIQENDSDKVSESPICSEENKDLNSLGDEKDDITDSEESTSQLPSSCSPEEDLSLISDSCDTFSLDPKLASCTGLEALTPESQDEQLVVSLPAGNDSSGEILAGSTDTGLASTGTAPSAAVSAPPGPRKDLEDQAGCSFDNAEASSPPSVYSVKWVMFNNNKVPLITQNENGPCPLIAIMNVLLLLKKIQFPAPMQMVTSDQLMSYLGDCIFENASKNITEDSRLNYEQNMQDAMAIFHKLQTGLDVNVRFTGVCDFEYTPECVIFDLLEIRLYHGWLVDPQEPQAVSAVGNWSYNQLVEKIIAQKSSDKEELVTEALLAETFLESSASQLTYHGLCELSTTVKEGELCVCFRNNHFSTLYRHKGELFILVTDQGFLTEPNVVWETLSNVEGDSHYVDANFHTYTKPELPPLIPTDLQVPPGSDQQIDQDYLVALSLQQEQQLQVDQGAGWNQQQQPQTQPQPAAPTVPLSDHEYALRLQEEEDQRAAAAYQQQQQQQQAPQQTPGAQQPQSPGSQSSSSSGGRRGQRERERKDKDSCTIL